MTAQVIAIFNAPEVMKKRVEYAPSRAHGEIGMPSKS